MKSGIIKRWDSWEGGIDCDASNKSWSAYELIELSNEISDRLIKIGLDKGDVIALVLTNTVMFPLMFIASLRIGCTPLLLHCSTTEQELNKIAKDVPIKWIFFDEINDLNRITHNMYSYIINIDVENLKIHILRFSTSILITNGSIDNTILHLTSGTSGTPLICLRNQDVAIAEALNYISSIPLYNRIKVRITTPFNHAFAYGFGLMSSIVSHSRLVIAPSFNPKRILGQEQNMRSDLLAIVPPMINSLSYLKKTNELYRLPKTVFYAGTRCNGADLREFEMRFKTKVYTIYGSTETGAITTNYSPDCNVRKGVGKVLKNVEISILNKTSYNSLKHGVGEVLVKSSSMMQQYFNKKNKRTLYHFNTNDIGYLDNNNCLHLIGRIKDVINISGIKVDPIEIENVILTHPLVMDCTVYRSVTSNNEEVIATAIVAHTSKITISVIKEYCFKILNSYKIPSIIHFVDMIPKTSSGKVKRFELPDYVEDVNFFLKKV